MTQQPTFSQHRRWGSDGFVCSLRRIGHIPRRFLGEENHERVCDHRRQLKCDDSIKLFSILQSEKAHECQDL